MESFVFEWDDVKSAVNSVKHGVSFDEAQLAFLDPYRLIYEDIKHSEEEKRFYCFGKVEHLVMTVRYTHRAHIIRIIGAGYWRSGRKIYEEENNIH